MKGMGIKEQIYLLLGALLWALQFITSEFRGGALSAGLAFLAICFIARSVCGRMIVRSRSESGA